MHTCQTEPCSIRSRSEFFFFSAWLGPYPTVENVAASLSGWFFPLSVLPFSFFSSSSASHALVRSWRHLFFFHASPFHLFLIRSCCFFFVFFLRWTGRREEYRTDREREGKAKGSLPRSIDTALYTGRVDGVMDRFRISRASRVGRAQRMSAAGSVGRHGQTKARLPDRRAGWGSLRSTLGACVRLTRFFLFQFFLLVKF